MESYYELNLKRRLSRSSWRIKDFETPEAQGETPDSEGFEERIDGIEESRDEKGGSTLCGAKAGVGDQFILASILPSLIDKT